MDKSMDTSGKFISAEGNVYGSQSQRDSGQNSLGNVSQGGFVSAGGTRYANEAQANQARGLSATNPINNQSTTTLSSNKNEDINKNVGTLNNLSNKGITSNTDTGVTTYADGTVQPEKKVTADTTDEDKLTNDYLESLRSSLDSNTSTQVANIQQKFNQRRAEQTDINTRAEKNVQNALLMGGATGQGSAAQYAPISSEGIIQAQETYGLRQIAALDSQENDLIAQAKQAQQDGNFRIMEKYISMAQDKRKEKVDAAAKLNEQIDAKNEEIRKENLQAQKESAIADVYSKGITDIPTAMAELKKAGVNATTKEVSDNIALLSGIGGSGIIAEYNYYKADAIRRGQVPLSFDEYQSRDANRKISLAKAGVADINGLDKEQRTRVAGLLDDYDKQTKDIKTVVSQANQIDSLSKLALSSNKDKGSRAAAQIGTIFSYMKMLDPTSTVREGEYATAQNTAGVDDKVRNAYNKAKDGSFLTDGQINGYVSTGKNIAESRKRQLDGINEEFDRRSAIFGIPSGIISKSTTTDTTGDDIIKSEDDAKDKIINYGKTNPKFQPIIRKKVSELNPFTGQKYTYSELLEIYPEIK